MKIKRKKSHPSAFWQKHVQEWRQSGLKQAKYCREQGFVQSQFGYWVRKLTQQPAARPEEFVEVSERVPLAPSVFAFDVEIPGGIRLRLDNADPEILKMVLRAIREAVC